MLKDENMPQGRITVLVIDDEIGDRRLVRRSLTDSGLDFDLLEATALSGAEDHHGQHVDLIVLDNQLPDGDGIGNIGTLRETFPEAAIIVATGSGDEQVAVSAIHGGSEDYISKARITGQALRRSALNAIRVRRLRRKVDAQNGEMQVFAHMLVHDFKAPIRNISWLAKAAEDDLGAVPEAETRTSLRDIQTCALRQMKLIEALTAHIGFGETAAFERQEMAELVRDVVRSLGPIVAERDAKIDIKAMPQAMCSGAEIRQLLQNLIANAIKFCPEAPVIRVGFETGSDGSTIFTVTDNGIGIPEALQTEVFLPFRRLHTHDEVPGSGLGLATCAKIVTRHGGKIWCETAPGGGLRVCFTLGSPSAMVFPLLGQPAQAS
ncbi:sensor histidine kinase [Heliomarina baculiformis]|uniref:sensor histidine kinase n=1 Tax=Heliomarina baculiformis TaxID=2872036 RepID=UPI001EE30956|nr:hybrid sensor histidine kinase/response regulator [Heliomarina baculiformis]